MQRPAEGIVIKEAAAAILRFVCGKTFDDYEQDELLRSGVERKFEIIGKALNGDGETDMILHFNTQDAGIACGDTSASLAGEIFSGQMIQGSDAVKTAGCK